MTTKTAPGTTNLDYKPLLAKMYYCDPFGSATYAEVQGHVSGKITLRVNASPTAELEYMNPQGKYTERFAIGGKIKLYLGYSAIDVTRPDFEGFITPGNGIMRRRNGLSFTAVGLSGYLKNELDFVGSHYDGIYLTTHSWDGYEAGALVKEIVESINGNPLSSEGIQSSWPLKYAGKDFKMVDGWQTKLDRVQSAIDGMADVENSAADPRPYYWYEAHGTVAGRPAMFVRKFPRLDYDSETLAIDWDDGLMELDETVRSEQLTSCICVSSSDPTKWASYENAVAVARFGRIQRQITYPSENIDDLQDQAFRHVQLYSRPIRSVRVGVLDPHNVRLLQVCRLYGGPYGTDEKRAVMEVCLPFGTRPEAATITLASKRESLTEFLT